MGVNRTRRYVLLSVSVLAFLALWHIASLSLGADVILPGPVSTFVSVSGILADPAFLASLGATALRGFTSFLVSSAAGLVLGAAGGLSVSVRTLLSVPMVVLRSVPMVSVVLLALIWFPVDAVPVFAGFLLAFPVVYTASESGIENTDRALLEMARTYGVSRGRALLFVYLPSLVSYLVPGMQSALGVIWKVVIAAEVLSLPKHAVGTELYDAKAMIDTPLVFAWTLAAVALTAASNGLFALTRRILSRRSS